MYLEKNLEKKWIIKSENKILGPYNFEQIVDLLRKKQISIIDEVRDPETRWLYVRENSEFKNVVEEIRKEIDSKQEATKTYQSTVATSTNTTTNFDDLAQKTKTDISPFTDINIEAKDAEIVKEVSTVAVAPLKSENTAPKVEKAKMYGVQTDAVVQKKMLDYSSKLKIAGAVAAVLILSTVGGYYYFQKRSVIKQEEENELQVKKFKYLGLTQKAVDIFATLPNTSQKKLMPELLDTYPLLESSGLLTVEDLKNLKSDPSINAEQKAYIELINFMAAMKQQNVSVAQDHLIKASMAQPTMALVIENAALFDLETKAYSEAFKKFQKLINIDSNGRYFLGQFEAYIGLPEQEKAEAGRALLQKIESYTNVHFDYRKELLLAQIYLGAILNDQNLVSNSTKIFFNTPCQMANQFKKPDLLLPSAYQWKGLNDVRDSVSHLLSGDNQILFQVHDLLEQNKLAEAGEFVRNNQTRVGSEAIREQMNLLILNALGKSREILAVRKANKLDMNSALNQFIVAENTLKIDSKRSIQDQLHAFGREFIFYKEWLELEQLILKNSTDDLRAFLKDHFITVKNFNPVFEARNLVN